MTVYVDDVVAWLRGREWLVQSGFMPRYHAVLCDPPYGLGFMGQEWDRPKPSGTVLHDPSTVGGFQDGCGGSAFSRSRIRYGRGAHQYHAWVTEWATLLLSFVYPGAVLLAFGGTRTFHRLAAGLEDAGWIIADTIAWITGQGFPKSHNGRNWDAGEHWHGYGTALKPAWEGVVVARAPWRGTYAALAREFGTGALAIDSCRIGTGEGTWGEQQNRATSFANNAERLTKPTAPERSASSVTANAEQTLSEKAKGTPGVTGKGATGCSAGLWWEEPSANPIGDSSLNTSECGKTLMEQSPKDTKSTISTETDSTTGLKTSDSLPDLSTAESTLPRAIFGEAMKPGAASVTQEGGQHPPARWPSNLILGCACESAEHDADCPVRVLGEQSGESGHSHWPQSDANVFGTIAGQERKYDGAGTYDNIPGTAARFFYVSKAAAWEREAGLGDFEKRGRNEIYGQGFSTATKVDPQMHTVEGMEQRPMRTNMHPTVKPIALTEYLARLILPPPLQEPRRLLIPFAGSGSEMLGARLAGWDVVDGIEQSAEYADIARARLAWWSQFSSYEQARSAAGADGREAAEREAARALGVEQLALFDGE